MSYNGHANYETWVVSMFMDGNYDGESTCRRFESIVDAAVIEAKEDSDSKSDCVYLLSHKLKSEIGNMIYGNMIYGEDVKLSSGAIRDLLGDLLGAALSEVDWRELAEGRVSDAWDRVEVEA